MLIGAVAGFSTAVSTGNAWLGLAMAMLAGGLISLVHAVVTIHLRADQVVSGLALTFLGTGLALVLGEGLSNAGETRPAAGVLDPAPVEPAGAGPDLLPRPEHPRLRRLRPRAARLVLDQPDAARASTCARSARRPPRPMPRASTSTGRATCTCSSAACWRASAGATITLAISPGWFSELTTGGRGWIAVGLVIFAQWSPLRAAFGAYLFGAISRFVLDVQGVDTLPRRRQPVPARPVGDVPAGHAAVPARDLRRGHRVTRGGAEAGGRAGGAGTAVCPGRARGLRRRRADGWRALTSPPTRCDLVRFSPRERWRRWRAAWAVIADDW